jgi:hypothetical protein
MRRLLAVGLAGLALAMASTGDAAQNFLDRRGDAHGAPDIFTLYLQDRWGGKPDFLYFGFGISDLPGKLLVDFDTDKNAATGGPSGSDYRVEVAVRTGGARLLRWSGNRFSPVASPTLRGLWTGARVQSEPHRPRRHAGVPLLADHYEWESTRSSTRCREVDLLAGQGGRRGWAVLALRSRA